MKRFFYTIISISLLFALISCDKGNSNSSSKYNREGLWTDYWTYQNKVSHYYEVLSSGKAKWYSLESGSAYLQDGVIYQTSDATWDLDYYGDFSIVDNSIYFNGFNQGDIVKVTDDIVYCDDESLTCGYARVKKFEIK